MSGKRSRFLTLLVTVAYLLGMVLFTAGLFTRYIPELLACWISSAILLSVPMMFMLVPSLRRLV